MNDSELDRLLDLWEAPPPRRLLRDSFKARMPRCERPGFVPPLLWALAGLFASVAFVIGLAGAAAIAQSGPDLSNLPIVRDVYQSYLEWRQAGEAKYIVARIAASRAEVFVDGRLVAPLESGPAATVNVQIPGAGLYSITFYPVARHTADKYSTGWVEAGYAIGNLIEFRAGGKQVRIECNTSLTDSKRPVFAIRRN